MIKFSLLYWKPFCYKKTVWTRLQIHKFATIYQKAADISTTHFVMSNQLQNLDASKYMKYEGPLPGCFCLIGCFCCCQGNVCGNVCPPWRVWYYYLLYQWHVSVLYARHPSLASPCYSVIIISRVKIKWDTPNISKQREYHESTIMHVTWPFAV